jgi:hypothetical protein
MMPLAETRRGVDVDPELAAHAVLEEQGQGLATLIPQPVRHAVRLQRVKALVVEKRDVQLVRRRIAIEHRQEVGAHCVEDLRVRVEGLQHHLAQQQRGCRRAVELVGQVESSGSARCDRD